MHLVLAIPVSLWCAALVAAPVFDSHLLYALFSTICHQIPERSWFLAGQPLAVCVRCAAIYGGFLAGVVLRIPPRAGFLRLAILVMGFEFVVARLWPDLASVRAWTGLALGAAAAGFVELGIREGAARLVARYKLMKGGG